MQNYWTPHDQSCKTIGNLMFSHAWLVDIPMLGHAWLLDIPCSLELLNIPCSVMYDYWTSHVQSCITSRHPIFSRTIGHHMLSHAWLIWHPMPSYAWLMDIPCSVMHDYWIPPCSLYAPKHWTYYYIHIFNHIEGSFVIIFIIDKHFCFMSIDRKGRFPFP